MAKEEREDLKELAGSGRLEHRKRWARTCEAPPRAPRSTSAQARGLGEQSEEGLRDLHLSAVPVPRHAPGAAVTGSGAPPPCLTHPHRDRPTPCQPPGRAPTWSRVFWVAQALTTDGMECSWHLAFKCPQESTSREQYGNIHKKRQGSMTLPQKRILRCIQTYTMTGMEGCAF